MSKVTVIFAHGRESGPWGPKIRALAKIAERFGCGVISRDDTDNRDPELRVTRLIDEVKSIEGSIVLVGSSMGGYVATVASQVIRPTGLFLMAPAFGLPDYAQQAPRAIARELSVVYGWGDNLVSLEAILDFSRSQQSMLHLVPAGHALLEQLEWLEQIFTLFLQRCLAPDQDSARNRTLATM